MLGFVETSLANESRTVLINPGIASYRIVREQGELFAD